MSKSAGDSGEKTEPSLYIIKSKPEGLTNAENWLRNKGWTVESTSQVKEALPKILQTKPEHIMICMDHANPKVKVLPKLLEQAFQTKIIAFVDGTSPSSIAALQGHEYVLYPPISGPAIDRMVGKIQRDKRRKENAAQMQAGPKKASTLGSVGDAMISIKGSANQEGPQVVIQDQARQMLQNMLAGENSQLVSSSKDSQTDAGTAHGSRGASPNGATSSLSHQQSSSPNGKAGSSAGAHGAAESARTNSADSTARANTAQSSARTSGAGASAQAGATETARPNADPGKPNGPTLRDQLLALQKEPGADRPMQNQNGNSTGANAHQQNDKESDAQNSNGQDPSSTDGKDATKTSPTNTVTKTAEGLAKPKSKAAALKSGLNNLFEKVKMITDFIRPESRLTKESNIVKSSQTAIEDAAVPDFEKATKLLSECTQLICFPVGTSEQHGYVLCAIAESPAPLEKFVGTFRNKLIGYMTEFDKHFTAGNPVVLNLQAVDFEDWALDQADFVKKFVHLDRECAVAYFDQEMDRLALSRHPIAKEMITVSVNEVRPERTLEFDFFLYLPRNERFVRYGRRGANISNQQKTRLESRGVSDIHLHEDSRVDLFRYRLQAFLDQKITTHKVTAKTRKSGSF